MRKYKSDLIRTLGLSENQFLQVLLDKWELEGNGCGVTLKVRFGEDTPAINTRQAKYALLAAMGDYYKEKRGDYQSKIDAFAAGTGNRTFAYDDERFPFRYVSGGTLPVVTRGGKTYFCLFYRDIFPIGWNIANGGCDTRGELHNPFRTIERELCEELLVINPEQRVRYIFERNKNKLMDGLEFEVADNEWEKKLARLDVANFTELMLPIKWIEGPDKVVARYEDSTELSTQGYFLNINTEDFGIEVDKVAHVSLDRSDLLLSGEIIAGRLVNEPIGLFNVDRFAENLPDPGSELVPDLFFFNTVVYDSGSFDEIMEKEFFPYISKYRTHEEHALWEKTGNKSGLCPVTRQIINRYFGFRKIGETDADASCDIFISFGEEDRNLACAVRDHLVKKNRRVFMRKEIVTCGEWGSVDRALESASSLIAVGSSRRALIHHFPSYEYRSFHRNMMFSQNGKRGALVSFVRDMKQQELPPPLCHSRTVVCDSRGMGKALLELESLL